MVLAILPTATKKGKLAGATTLHYFSYFRRWFDFKILHEAFDKPSSIDLVDLVDLLL